MSLKSNIRETSKHLTKLFVHKTAKPQNKITLIKKL